MAENYTFKGRGIICRYWKTDGHDVGYNMDELMEDAYRAYDLQVISLKKLPTTTTTTSFEEPKLMAEIRSLYVNRGSIEIEDMQMQYDDGRVIQPIHPDEAFTRGGALRDRIYKSDFHRGTGCWGSELNHSNVVDEDFWSIYMLYVDPAERGRDLGSWLLRRYLHEKASKSLTSDNEPYGYVVCGPLIPLYVASYKERYMMEDEQAKFLRKNGFRRIGRTSLFAFALHPQHPSHCISSAEDAAVIPLRPRYNGKRDQATHFTQYPIHNLIDTRHKEDIIRTALFIAYDSDPLFLINDRDELGHLPLHTAVLATNVAAVDAILALGGLHVPTMLLDANNYYARTPLNQIQSQMRRSIPRDQNGGTALHSWGGHSRDHLRIMWMLVQAGRGTGANFIEDGEHEWPVRPDDSEERFIYTRRWGCTCGRCVEGSLTQGMITRMCEFAQEMTERMDYEIENIEKKGSKDTSLHPAAPGLSFIPPEFILRDHLDFYKAFRTLIPIIANILHMRVFPTPDAVSLAISNTAPVDAQGQLAFFFENGGLPHFAVDFLLWNGSEEPELVDEQPSDLWCANDSLWDVFEDADWDEWVL